jgi:hypothetical protein
LGLLLAPLSPAYAVRGRPEKKMAFQSTRVKARTDMKSEIRPKRGEEEGTEEQTEATAGSSGSYSFTATGDSGNQHSARRVFRHNNP